MECPVQITYRNLQSSPSIDARIHEEIAKLGTCFSGIISCRVTVELPHLHHERGNPFHLLIDVSVPGAEIVVNHAPTLHGALRKTEATRTRKVTETQGPHKDLYVAIRDAFKAARRELQDYVRRQRSEAKQHEESGEFA
jgi:ribosome-associated translation inhibitor RaiA